MYARARRLDTRRRRSPITALVWVALLIALAAYGYTRYQQHTKRQQIDASKPAARIGDVSEPVQAQYRCDGRTRCSQMTSCEEAKFFLKNCPGTLMDGDDDGIPCEDQWCGSPTK